MIDPSPILLQTLACAGTGPAGSPAPAYQAAAQCPSDPAIRSAVSGTVWRAAVGTAKHVLLRPAKHAAPPALDVMSGRA